MNPTDLDTTTKLDLTYEPTEVRPPRSEMARIVYHMLHGQVKVMFVHHCTNHNQCSMSLQPYHQDIQAAVEPQLQVIQMIYIMIPLQALHICQKHVMALMAEHQCTQCAHP